MIVVTAPTGDIGHQVLERLLDSGEPIRGIVRDPSRLPPQTRNRVEVQRDACYSEFRNELMKLPTKGGEMPAGGIRLSAIHRRGPTRRGRKTLATAS
jgi:hypothetical protein